MSLTEADKGKLTELPSVMNWPSSCCLAPTPENFPLRAATWTWRCTPFARLLLFTSFALTPAAASMTMPSSAAGDGST